MLIKNPRFVLTPEELLENESIVVEGNKIRSIGGEDKTGKVIDASNHAVLPGLVNMHTHASMNLFRGVSDDKELQPWLQEDIWPLEENLDEEKSYWGAMHAFLEMVKSGTTCFNDMYFYMDRVAEAAEKIGLRGYFGHGMIDLDDPQKRNKELKETRRIIDRLNDGFSDRIKPAVTPHSAETCSEELLLQAKKISEERGVPMHMHLAETQKEVEKVMKEKGKRPVEYLNDLDLLDENFIGAHGVHLNKEDIKTLSEAGASVVHNPCSNMKLASGVSPVAEMLEKNVNVCLGTDGAASNNNLNMFEELKFASLLQKINRSDPTTMPIQDALKLPWNNAAKALNKDVGRIEEGALADLILVDLDHVSMRPLHNLKSNLVYSGAEVDTSIIDGEVVMRGGELTEIDEGKVMEKAVEQAEELVD
ncbi:MAG: amidohydrolase [Candidatus Aenigmatarchaeota archaeon]